MGNTEGLFRAISEALKEKGNGDQRTATACFAMLDKTIRPTIREAKKQISNPNIDYREGNVQPFIAVRGRYNPPEEIRFICRDRILEIRMNLEGQSNVNEIAIENVTEDLIAEQIGVFLRQALGLPI